ncbi:MULTISPECIES: hypothetical protein [Streptosporangiaceae]|uniref:hypothetical protein n=1 Tax=Streptosporangiaceae TaxID=2004 RepID=UPI0033FA5D1F
MALSPTAWTPETGLSYAEWLKAKAPQTRPQGWTNATHDQVREGIGKDGRRYKATTDQLGNDTVQHGHDQQSVKINAPLVRVATTTTEERAHG